MTEDLALKSRTDATRGRVLSWALWDWGTQPFNSVIITFVFAVYITSSPFGDTNYTSTWLAITTMLSGFAIALLAPVLGQSADRSGKTVSLLRIMTWVLALIAGALYFVKPEPGYLWLGLTLLAVGSLVNEIAGVNYNATIDQVASAGNVGRVSGFGWGMGYLGGIVALLMLYFGFIAPKVGLFGVTDAEGLDIRASMLVCMVWIFLFTIPPFLTLRDKPPTDTTSHPGVVGSYKALGRTIAHLWRTDRPLIYFLMASALFRDGLAGVFAFGAVIAAGTFGFSSGEVVIFGAVANVAAGISTILMGLLDDKIGPKRVILISLACLVALGIAIFALHDGGRIVFWTVGLGMTLFVGPAQSASRSYLARLIPDGKSGEIFGLYATTGRVVSFLSPGLFAAAVVLGSSFMAGSNTQYWGILGIVVVLAAGFVVMLMVPAPPAEHSAAELR